MSIQRIKRHIKIIWWPVWRIPTGQIWGNKGIKINSNHQKYNPFDKIGFPESYWLSINKCINKKNVKLLLTV